MRTASLQQKLEKKGPFIFSSSDPSALPCSSAQWLNTRTLEADSLHSHSGLHDPEGAGSLGRAGGNTREGADPEACLSTFFPAVVPKF